MVEKPDVIGAIFGQTEGLLGPDLDLRELQRTGRIGRIDVFLRNENGKTTGKIRVPSSLDLSETALIAAAIETIERIGPCSSVLKVRGIKDIRSIKRSFVMKRAKELIRRFMEEEIPDSSWLSERLKESVRVAELSNYKGLPSGPNIENYDEIILVEGRADVINLLKNGIKNVVAIGGTSIPQPIIDLCKRKVVTVFVDGDRGGDLIVKELLQLTDIDYVAKSPEGKEVEELTKKEIFKALRSKVPVGQYRTEIKSKKVDERIRDLCKKTLEEIVGTRAVYLFDKNLSLIGKIPLSNKKKIEEESKSAYVAVVDGTLTQDVVDLFDRAGVEIIAGVDVEEGVESIGILLTRKDFE